MTSEEPPPVRIWALLGARAGDNDQVIALARALGTPFEVKRLQYNRLHGLGPRLLGRSLASLTEASRAALLAEAPPDLTISTGHRSVPVIRWLRHRSGSRMRSIHVGFPRVSPDHFDLVVTTPQYPVPDRPNVLRIPYALTSAAVGSAKRHNGSAPRQPPGPRQVLIVGGPTLYWELDEPLLLRTLSRLLDEARDDHGSVVIATSPRTPSALIEQISRMLTASSAPTLLARPGGQPSYEAILAAADTLHVTADSVSMTSDAIWTGKPMAIVPIARSALGRRVFGVMDRLAPGARVYPQDLRFFWKALAEIGVTEQLATPTTSTDDVLRETIERAKLIVSAASAGSTSRA